MQAGYFTRGTAKELQRWCRGCENRCCADTKDEGPEAADWTCRVQPGNILTLTGLWVWWKLSTKDWGNHKDARRWWFCLSQWGKAMSCLKGIDINESNKRRWPSSRGPAGVTLSCMCSLHLRCQNKGRHPQDCQQARPRQWHSIDSGTGSAGRYMCALVVLGYSLYQMVGIWCICSPLTAGEIIWIKLLLWLVQWYPW